MSILYFAGGIVFFVLCLGFVGACERLRESGQ